MENINQEFGLCLSYGKINGFEWKDDRKVETFDQF